MQAVAAQHQRVPRLEGMLLRVRRQIGARPDDVGQDVAHGMPLDLDLRECHALGEQFRNPGIVLGQLRQAPLAHPVDAAVADAGEDGAGGRHQRGGHGRPHARALGTARRGVEDVAIGGPHGVFKAPGRGLLLVADKGANRFDGKTRRHFARVVPAHPVRHDEHAARRVDQERIFIARTRTRVGHAVRRHTHSHGL